MTGTLIVIPLEAKFNHLLKRFVKIRPYCIAIIGDNQISGMTSKEGGLNPKWSDAMVMKLRGEKNCFVEVKDRCLITSDTTLGICEINIESVTKEKETKGWYHLYFRKRPVGTIHIQTIYSIQDYPPQHITYIKDKEGQSEEDAIFLNMQIQKHIPEHGNHKLTNPDDQTDLITSDGSRKKSQSWLDSVKHMFGLHTPKGKSVHPNGSLAKDNLPILEVNEAQKNEYNPNNISSTESINIDSKPLEISGKKEKRPLSETNLGHHDHNNKNICPFDSSENKENNPNRANRSAKAFRVKNLPEAAEIKPPRRACNCPTHREREQRRMMELEKLTNTGMTLIRESFNENDDKEEHKNCSKHSLSQEKDTITIEDLSTNLKRKLKASDFGGVQGKPTPPTHKKEMGSTAPGRNLWR